MINVEEGLYLLRQELTRSLGVDEGIYKTDEGKLMLARVSAIYFRHLHHDFLTNGKFIESKFMGSIASVLHDAGETDSFIKAKEMSDLLTRYEYAGNQEDFDGKPEGEAYFRVSELIEEGFCELEEIGRAFFKEVGRESIFQFKVAGGIAGHSLILEEEIVRVSSVLKLACSSRKVYNDIIMSIVFSE